MRLAFLAPLALIAAPALAQDAPVLGWALGPALEGVDRDGDGLFDATELGASAAGLPATFDLDGDGTWSVVELSQGFFALYDIDDSGLLEQDEIEAMRGIAAAGVYALDI